LWQDYSSRSPGVNSGTNLEWDNPIRSERYVIKVTDLGNFIY